MTDNASTKRPLEADETSAQIEKPVEQPTKRTITSFRRVLDGAAAFKDDWFTYEPNVFPVDECERLMADVLARYTFKRNTIDVCGIQCQAPRTEALLARDAGVVRMASRASMTTQAWDAAIATMRTTLAQRYRVEFDACLVTLFRSGKDHVARRAEDASELETDLIVTVSLGVSRVVRVFDTETNAREIELNTQPGSVYVQHRGAQRLRKTEVPTQPAVLGKSLTLSFRRLKQLK